MPLAKVRGEIEFEDMGGKGEGGVLAGSSLPNAGLAPSLVFRGSHQVRSGLDMGLSWAGRAPARRTNTRQVPAAQGHTGTLHRQAIPIASHALVCDL